jgi:hypothetical protein
MEPLLAFLNAAGLYEELNSISLTFEELCYLVS